MDFGIFADLDEAGIRCQKIGIAEIPEIRFVLQTCIEKKLPLTVVFIPEFVKRFYGCNQFIVQSSFGHQNI